MLDLVQYGKLWLWNVDGVPYAPLVKNVGHPKCGAAIRQVFPFSLFQISGCHRSCSGRLPSVRIEDFSSAAVKTGRCGSGHWTIVPEGESCDRRCLPSWGTAHCLLLQCAFNHSRSNRGSEKYSKDRGTLEAQPAEPSSQLPASSSSTARAPYRPQRRGAEIEDRKQKKQRVFSLGTFPFLSHFPSLAFSGDFGCHVMALVCSPC